ncbi:MAG: hypothetical protein ACOCXD_03500, partial [Bacteroidota bacterium]
MALLIIQGFIQGDGVKLKINAPQTVQAGEEFIVRVKLAKSDLESFSRYSQPLPAGLRAEPLDVANADFTFQENRIRMIWLKLPEGDSLEFSYKVYVDERLKGSFDINGLFSYIDENQRKSVETGVDQISITPSPRIDPSLIVDINDFKEQVIPDLTPRDVTAVYAIRQEPEINREKNEVLVNVLIHKEDKKRFAKIEETVPPGFTAVEQEKKDAIFTFKDGMVKFLWMNLPLEPYFVVSYKLIPLNSRQVSQPDINGTFSFIENKQTTSVDIVQEDFIAKDLTDEKVNELIAGVKEKINQESDYYADAIQANQRSTSPEKDTPRETNDIPETKQDNGQLTQQSANQPRKVNKQLADRFDMSNILEPKEGIYYRVQVAAGHKPVNIEQYFKKFNLDNEVRTESHEGW